MKPSAQHLLTCPSTRQANRMLIRRLCKLLAPPERISTYDWSRKHRRLSGKASALPGIYNPDLTPWVRGMHDALDDPRIRKIVVRKSAQVGWTDGVVLNYMAKRIDVDPCGIIVMFPKEMDGKSFNKEKLLPMAEVTPRITQKLPVNSRKDQDNSWNFKSFPGGFLKLVGSNSPGSVKSTSAPVLIVEEPDDCNTNLREQGDTIVLLEERGKTYASRKVIFGGTPTVDGFSKIDAEYKSSDQRVFLVPCHACDETHVLAWENVRWIESDAAQHEIFGRVDLNSARYSCPHCGTLWTDIEKNRNVRRATWVATAPFSGVAGFYINELYSPFPGSTLRLLLEKYLTALHHLDQGDDTKMRAFVNSTEGLPYKYKTDLADADVLRGRAIDYPEFFIPWGGLLLTAGVDVQHDRLAIIIRSWGRGEESWLIYWGEIHGETLIPEAGAWVELDALLTRAFQHASGASLYIRAVSIDSSDGQTSDAVYAFVRARQARQYMAIKGASADHGKKEIFTRPSESVDVDRKGKAWKYGLRPYIVGTMKAKDLITARFQLQGNGPGRAHWYSCVRPDYWDQVTAEVKIPHKTKRNVKVWSVRAGQRNEALDCEVYALHAARSLKINLFKESQWLALENKIRQAEMFDQVETPAPNQEPDESQEEPAPPQQPKPPPPPPQKKQRQPRQRGWSANSW
ncbi:phage terminase large subunit family protein [Massilia sp. W12]|uniref:phage terminase large subunit family protein n=1 Tax=Massilia sp. W12 TaxID=3126507 RepID=UPI0030CD56DB